MDRPGPRAAPTRAGRRRGTRWREWWHGLSDPDRFRVYTRGTTEGTTIALAVVLAVSVDEPWLVLALGVTAAAGALALESRPELATWMADAGRTRARGAAAGLLVAVAVTCAVIAHTAREETLAGDAEAVGVFALLVLVMTVVTFLPHRGWIVIGLGLLAGPAYQDTPTDMATTAAFTVVGGGFVVAMTLLSLWGLRVVDDLEHAREAEAELTLARERLRFARDLHDVVGRGFSAVAVKSELAATLSRAGAGERAATEMEDVQGLAVESMEQMRSLVRGYRDISLASEVAGARSLLAAAGCRLTVVGEPGHIPPELHEAAAWVVREGTTNIVKHTSATRATLELGSGGMSLDNDDATDAGPGRSGHTGLAERLEAVGATMSTTVDDGWHLLEVRWTSR